MTENKNNSNALKEAISLIVESVIEEQPGGRLRDIFLDPARDVIKTAGYAAEKISASVQGLIKGFSFLIPAMLIPGLEFDYDLFRKDELKHMDGLKKKYGDVLARNWEAIKDPDVFGFLFLAYPQAMLGYAALKKSPLAFLGLLETLTGGMPAVSSMRQRLASTAAYTPRKTQHSDPAAGMWGGMDGAGAYGDYGGYGFGESVDRLTEQPAQVAQPAQPVQQPAQNEQLINQIWALVQNPEVQKKVAQSPMFRDMQAAAVDIMVSPVAKVMQAQNLDQLVGPISQEAVAKTKAEIAKNPDFQKASDKDKQAIQSQLMQGIKNEYKKAYVKRLQAQVASVPQAKQGVDMAVAKISQLK